MEYLSLQEYRPYQSMSETANKCSSIRCKQYRPSKHLQPYISCYWTMTSGISLEEPILHRVIPDGCIDIIFNLNRHSYGQAASIVGTMTKPIFAELKDRVNFLAIRFLPGGFPHFFDIPVCYLTDQIISLDMISGIKGHKFTEQLVEKNHIGDKIELLENYFGHLLMRNNKHDPSVRIALYNILKHKGNIGITQLSKRANNSQRQLCRKFNQWLGVSPKSFCRIIRFQNILRMLPSHSRCNLLFIALDGGYYDQSHFIHEFNSLYGLNPSEFLKSKKS